MLILVFLLFFLPLVLVNGICKIIYPLDVNLDGIDVYRWWIDLDLQCYDGRDDAVNEVYKILYQGVNDSSLPHRSPQASFIVIGAGTIVVFTTHVVVESFYFRLNVIQLVPQSSLGGRRRDAFCIS